MNEKTIRYGLPTIIAIGCVSIVFQYIISKLSTLVVSAQTSSGLPIRIIIPKIHLDAEIDQVSVDSNNFILPPKSELSTGWNKLSALPGEEGSAIIDGYVSGQHGPTAMFGDLHYLKVKDIIIIKNDRGVDTSFIIKIINKYNLDTDISTILSSDDKKSHLNLITYDGIWDKVNKSYSKRLVIFADKIITTPPPP